MKDIKDTKILDIMSEVRLPEQIEPERKEREPKINYHFLYSAHRTAKDFKNLDKAFENADVYVPEMAGWTPEYKQKFQAVSDGKLAPAQVESDYSSHTFHELEAIFNSKKLILVVDLPWFDIENDVQDLYNNQDKLLKLFMRGRFSESVKLMRANVKAWVEFQLKREDKMKKNLDEQIGELLKNDTKYSNKDELNILIKLGAFHTPLYHKLKADGKTVSREFRNPLTIYGSFIEAKRRMVFGKTIEDELLARAILETIIIPHFEAMTDDSNKLIWVTKKMGNQLSYKDIEEISNLWGQKGGIDLIEELKKRGVKVPKNEGEMDKMLGLNKGK